MRDLLYILSPSFSGSTLLTFLLAAHPDIATVGELKASAIGDVGTYRCSCGSLLIQCKFWRRIKEEMAHRGANFRYENFYTHFSNGDEFVAFRRMINLGSKNDICAGASDVVLKTVPGYRELLNKIVEQNRALVEVISAIQNGRIFLDASKDPERLNQLSRTGHWQIKVIRLLRDGRGIAYSYMKHTRAPMQQAAREFLKTDRACDRIVRRLNPSDLLTVKYEDICSHPEETIEKILSRLDLNRDKSGLRRSPSELHILGNSMRLKAGSSVMLDEAWRTELTWQDLATFDKIAGGWNASRGYG